MILLAIVAAGAESAQLAPPVARQVPATIDIHGRTLVDPYSWMDDPNDPELIAYAEAEIRYASAVMAGTEALQRRLFGEMASRMDETDVQPPRFFGEDAFYVRYAFGRQYPLVCRRLGGLHGREQVLFDLNASAREGKKPALGGWRISPDFRLAALSIDPDGSQSFTIFVRSLEGEIRGVAQITGAGHMGSAGRADRLREAAFEYAFQLRALNVEE